MAEEKDYIKYLSKVHIEGYKSLDNTEVSLVPGLNIIIGTNGSGKSNFLEAVDTFFLHQAEYRKPYDFERIIFDFKTSKNKLVSLDTKRKNEEYLKNSKDAFNNGRNKYAYHFLLDNKDYLSENVIKLKDGNTKLGGLYGTNIYNFQFLELSISPPDITFVQYNLPNIQNGNIFLDKPGTIEITGHGLRSPENTFIFEEIQQLNSLSNKLNKENIHSYLKFNANLKFKLKTFSNIEDIRFTKNISFYKEEKSTRFEFISVEFKINGQWMSWERLSDGSKRLFYLIYSVHHAKGITLIEEPELGVHPHQFFKIMNFLKEEAEDKQIIISTHSPQALNVLNEKELGNIIVTNYDKKKGTVMRHLSAAEKKKAKAYMKDVGFLSDYWMYSPDLDEE